jgi:hypothetical protein
MRTRTTRIDANAPAKGCEVRPKIWTGGTTKSKELRPSGRSFWGSGPTGNPLNQTDLIDSDGFPLRPGYSM